MSRLTGRRILVTRRHEQSAALVRGLEAMGAEVLSVPVLERVPPADPQPFARAMDGLPSYHWLVFTSANAVDAVADHLDGRGRRLPSSVRIACVGPSTAAAVGERLSRAEVALSPERDFSARGLQTAFAALGVEGRRVLLPSSERGRPELAQGLRALGAHVDAVAAYTVSTVAAPALEAALEEGVDVVALASPSAVEAFVAAGGDRARATPVAVIGPLTASAARDAGLRVAAVAEPSTAEGLVAAVSHFLAP